MPHNCLNYLTVVLIVILYQAVPTSEDLLDEYVKHVENVNRLGEYEQPNLNKFKEPLYQNQRSKRLVRDIRMLGEQATQNSNKEDSPTRDLNPSSSFMNHILNVKRIHSKRNGSPRNHTRILRRHRRDVPVDTDIRWTHSASLDSTGNVVLRWQPRHQEVLFRVEARTRGYVGLGFSPDGGMQAADIVIAWVEDGTGRAHLLDCHGVPRSQGSAPVKDEIDNYTVLKGSQNDTHTVIEFKRVLDTCDPNDYVLTGDTVRVIWAMHDVDPQHDYDLVYHGESRGSQSLHLLGPPPIPKPSASSTRYWDVTLRNFEIPHNMDTIYWCKIFKAPTLNHKNHIIGYEPIIGDNHTSHVHHMIMHECQLEQSADVKKWSQFSNENGHMCYGSDMPVEWNRCITPLIAWAVGSKGENFQKDFGLPLDHRKNMFYMMEIHFDNPMMKRSRDSSGLKIHYTPELREHEGGVFATGVALSTLHFIPPYQKEYKTAGYCSFDCTKEVLPKNGINVVSVMLHSHLAGRKMKLRHLRSGKELPPLAEDNRYDFNYQQSRPLTPQGSILPGDGLITECTYSTLKRRRPTLGGYSTNDEMCLAFVTYYPRTPLAGCFSMPPIRYFFDILGVKEFYGHDMNEVEDIIMMGENEIPVSAPTPTGPLFPNNPGDEHSPEANRKAIEALLNAKEYIIEGESSSGISVFDKLIIKEPLEFQNKTFTSHLQDIPYNETLITKKMEEFFYKGLHFTFCRKGDDTPATKEKVVNFPNFTSYSNSDQVLCSFKNRRSYSGAASTNISKLKVVLFLPVLLLIYFT